MKVEAHNAYQRRYFETVERSRISPVDSPYVRAHVKHMVDAAGLEPGQLILEIGSGPGKFTSILAQRGFQVTANDLSPQLLERLTSSPRERSKHCAAT